MIFLSSFHLLMKRCRQSSSTRIFIPRQIFSTTLQTSQRETLNLRRKVKETASSLVIVTGVVALSGLCYLICHEFYSRESPNGIYKEASKLCLADSQVQEALGIPIVVHRAPHLPLIPLNSIRAKLFDEKGHRSMTVAFYLTGKERSGVVAVKVRKNISNRFVYDYILVQLDRSWQGQNILHIHRNQ